MTSKIETLSKEIEELLIKEGYELFNTPEKQENLPNFYFHLNMRDQNPFWDIDHYIIISGEHPGEQKVYVHHGKKA